jgi:hypothetical protein
VPQQRLQHLHRRRHPPVRVQGGPLRCHSLRSTPPGAGSQRRERRITGDGHITGWHRWRELKFGDSVAIFARGPVGLSAPPPGRAPAAQACRPTVESIPRRIEMSKRLGAAVVINPQEKDPVAGSGLRWTAVEAVGTEPPSKRPPRHIRRGAARSPLLECTGAAQISIYHGPILLPSAHP